jgi:hypothetical protein
MVGNVVDLLEVVADHHDGEPSAAEATDELEDLAGLHHSECGGGLVEDDDPGLAEQRARDGDRLPLTAGERADVRTHTVRADDRWASGVPERGGLA